MTIDLDRQRHSSSVSGEAMSGLRLKVRELAVLGYTSGEITAHLGRELSEVEHEILWRVACEESRRARGERLLHVRTTDGRPGDAGRGRQ
jgi:hypothetical protein